MCGVAGIVAFTEQGKSFLGKIENGIACLNKRGPDANGVFLHNNVALGHTRLSVIDTSAWANQPITDASGRFTIIFNGEFFNFKEHKKLVLDKGFQLKSESDTEVLLYLYLIEGEKCLHRINGFFSLAIYDSHEQSLFLARDRMGVKPLLMFEDNDKFMFASEMKSLIAMGVPKKIDEVSLLTYLQLNYIPAPHSIFKRVGKLEPGHQLKWQLKNGKWNVEKKKYYSISYSPGSYTALDYEAQQKRLYELMDESVKRRLISDVPLGAFLSGGLDSSVVTALASRHTAKLNTFSIGFRDEPLFDETRFANMVAKKCNTNHHVFSLTDDDLFENLHSALDYIDEPFADSSALNVFILSQQTKKHVTVALSGDGADELFAGYNKHAAEMKARKGGVVPHALKLLSPLLRTLPQSRNTKYGNKIRQLNRFADGINLSEKERYWRWASFEREEVANDVLKESVLTRNEYRSEYLKRKSHLLQHIHSPSNLNDVLYTDMHLVLPNDMLTKVDLMSMANSLEVRTPFLDYEVVDFAFTLPDQSKVNHQKGKKILRDTFSHLLPDEIYSRPKQGFEVPLLKWFQTGLKSMITDELLSDQFVKDQGVFNPESIHHLLKRLYSSNPGESVSQTWALIVFQYWWKRTMN